VSHKDRRYNEQFRPEFSKLHADRDLRWVVPFSVRYLIAITGSRFAGKSTALAHLSEKRGFELYSLTTTLRETAVELGVPLEPRFRLQDLGDELRAHFGDPAFLARMTLRRIHRDHLDQRGAAEPLRRIAVGGFKRLEELRLFEGLGRFQHIQITASDEVRLGRAEASGVGPRELRSIGVDAKLDQETFRQHIDGRDLEGHDYSWTKGFGQAVGELLEAPSKMIPNEGKQADLAVAIDKEISELDKRYRAFSG
jgi:dephospho-CoA kinase